MTSNSCMGRPANSGMSQSMYSNRAANSYSNQNYNTCGQQMHNPSRMTKPAENGCGTAFQPNRMNPAAPCTASIPTGNRQKLLSFINEVSFAVYETLLFLDTHPTCQEAMQFFQEQNQLRSRALKEYARLYGPLTIETANDCEANCWEWMNQPWPWEGGAC